MFTSLVSARRAAPGAPSRRVLPTVLAGCLALGACSQAEPDPFEGIPAFPVDTPAVTLLESGADPQVLRYQDVADAAGEAEPWSTTVEVAGGVAQAVAPRDADVDPQAPSGGDIMATTLPLTVTVSPAPAPGDGEEPAARAVLVEAGAGKHSDLALGQEIAAAEGFLMRWRAAETGLVSTVQLLAPADSPEAGRQAVESALLAIMSAAVVFPEEPVGVGGSWTVEGRVTGDTAMRRTATYTVAGISGTQVELDVRIDDRPAQQTLRIDNQAAGDLNGQTLSVASTATTSDGRITVDLTRPLPVDGRLASTTRLIYSGDDSDFGVVQDITSAISYGKAR